MQFSLSRILSLLIAIAYVAGAHAFKGSMLSLKVAVGLSLPMALIWFPEELGSFTGWYRHGCEVRTETPAIVVSVMGWFFLVGLPVLLYVLI